MLAMLIAFVAGLSSAADNDRATGNGTPDVNAAKASSRATEAAADKIDTPVEK